jgi:predicted phage terminase large subunit-like protein
MFPGAIHGKRIGWVTKTSGVAEDIWRILKATLEGHWAEKSETYRRLVLPGGGQIEVKSGDEPDSLRGPGYDGLILDEAAHMAEEVWHVLRPTLAERRGWAEFLSTPNYKRMGRWFRRLYDQAKELPDWESWQRPTADNQMIPAKEIEAARQTMAPLLFRQEFLAEFVEDAGAIFKADWFRYYRTVTDDGSTGLYRLLQPEREAIVAPMGAGKRYATMDLAASLKTTADYTVIGAFESTDHSDLLALDIDRRRMEGPDQIPALERMVGRYGLGTAWMERTGYQLAMVQTAIRRGLPVRELVADRDKLSRSMPLQARMAAGTVYFPEGAPWVPLAEAELLSFSGEPDGARKDGLESDTGYHDDIVDVLAYAAQVQGQHRAPRIVRLA